MSLFIMSWTPYDEMAKHFKRFFKLKDESKISLRRFGDKLVEARVCKIQILHIMVKKN